MTRMRLAIIGVIACLGLVLGVTVRTPHAGTTATLALPPARYAANTTVEIGGVLLEADVAADDAARARGLSGRTGLDPDKAMIFLFDGPGRYGFWMHEMFFPIDMFWVRDGVIVAIKERAPAPVLGTPDSALPIYTPDTEADTVVETAAGFARTHSVKTGDRISVHRPIPAPPAKDF